MASDQRWTGGIANREWQAGRPAEPVADREAILAQVRRYLADCRRHQAILNPKYHPTVDGAVKITFGPQAVVRAAYQQLTAARATAPGQGSNSG